MSFRTKKVFNNNVVLVDYDGKEKILFGKGIGFGKKHGDEIDAKDNIEKIFTLDNDENSKNFENLINYTDSNVIGMCEEAIYMIQQELDEELDEKIHISLTDHIAFTLKRLQSNEEIQNPFLVETETLYNKEFKIATKVARFIEKTMGIEIPDGEIGFITLHIHTARNSGKLSNTIKYAFLSNTVIEYIEDNLDIYVDRQSLDYARFITHIRFSIERILEGTTVKNDLIEVIKDTFEESFKLAESIGKILEDEIDKTVDENEISYLAMHIERLKNTNS